mmetsp:Transcript_4082/g.17103  ORF Transcript_4082/g.17103 Transcript_4082/m.17103 type:complete len:203 (-) Transcript_4082:219-827(-)
MRTPGAVAPASATGATISRSGAVAVLRRWCRASRPRRRSFSRPSSTSTRPAASRPATPCATPSWRTWTSKRPSGSWPRPLPARRCPASRSTPSMGPWQRQRQRQPLLPPPIAGSSSRRSGWPRRPRPPPGRWLPAARALAVGHSPPLPDTLPAPVRVLRPIPARRTTATMTTTMTTLRCDRCASTIAAAPAAAPLPLSPPPA